MTRLPTTLALAAVGCLTAAAFAPPSRPRSARLSPLGMSDQAVETDVDCIVVGGGISGSTLAHNLHNSDVDVLLTEARDYLGGNVRSELVSDSDGDFVYEKGPNSFATQPSIVRIAHELGIDDQLVFDDESLPPWVNYGGKLHPLPKGQGGKGPK